MILRTSISDQEEMCLIDDELTVVLNLRILEDKTMELTEMHPSSPPSLSFNQFFDSDQFSDFTIKGKDGLVIKAHKVSLRPLDCEESIHVLPEKGCM